MHPVVLWSLVVVRHMSHEETCSQSSTKAHRLKLPNSRLSTLWKRYAQKYKPKYHLRATKYVLETEVVRYSGVVLM